MYGVKSWRTVTVIFASFFVTHLFHFASYSSTYFLVSLSFLGLIFPSFCSFSFKFSLTLYFCPLLHIILSGVTFSLCHYFSPPPPPPPTPIQPAQLPTFSHCHTTVVCTKPRTDVVSRHMAGEFSDSLACRELASFSASL